MQNHVDQMPFETSYIIDEEWVGRVEYDESDERFPFRLLVYVPATGKIHVRDFRNALALDQFVDKMEVTIDGIR